MSEEEYNYFFKEVKEFKEKQNKQKQRGLNDYNILTTVLKAHDEVRVHSRMIASFLDIHGKHYQDSLFLEKFLDKLGIKNYDFNNSKMKVEYENIDLYLTDGIKHIIIENKIWAGDQKAQIRRYIDIIQNENQDLDYNNLYVIYLSIDRELPSTYSLDKLKIKDNHIFNEDKKIAIYKTMHYKTDILNWLKDCQYEVQNITNLNEAIKQYIDVVKIITGKYKGKVKNMNEIILKNEEYLEMSNNIYNEFSKIRIDIVKTFFTKYLVNYFEQKFDNNSKYKDWSIELDTDIVKPNFYAPIRIGKKNWNIIFKFHLTQKI